MKLNLFCINFSKIVGNATHPEKNCTPGTDIQSVELRVQCTMLRQQQQQQHQQQAADLIRPPTTVVPTSRAFSQNMQSLFEHANCAAFGRAGTIF